MDPREFDDVVGYKRRIQGSSMRGYEEFHISNWCSQGSELVADLTVPGRATESIEVKQSEG